MAFAGCGRLAVLVIFGAIVVAPSCGTGLAHGRREGLQMCNLSEWIVREALLAYGRAMSRR